MKISCFCFVFQWHPPKREEEETPAKGHERRKQTPGDDAPCKCERNAETASANFPVTAHEIRIVITDFKVPES